MNGNMKNFKEYIKAIVKKVIAEEKTKYTTEQEHSELIDTMKPFLDERPQVGIFWYDYQNNRLFGVKKLMQKIVLKRLETEQLANSTRAIGRKSIIGLYKRTKPIPFFTMRKTTL